MLLHWIVGAVLGAAVIGTIVIVVQGVINKNKLREEMKARGTEEFFVEKINNAANTISCKDFLGNEYEVTGDGIANDIHENDVIYV